MDSIVNTFTKLPIFLCCFCGCKLYDGAISVQNALLTRLWHVVIFVLYIASAWILHNYGHDIIQYFPILNNLCPEEICSILLIYRLSFALFIFHMTLAVMLYGVNDKDNPRAYFQNQCWQLKFPYLLLLLVLSAFIPESFFVWYGWAAFVGGIVFIFAELFILIDLAHTLTEYPSRSTIIDENTHKNIYFPMIFCTTIGMYVLSLILIFYTVFLFEELHDCHVNIFIIVLTVIIIVAVTLVSTNPKIQSVNKHLGLFQAAVVTLFSTFLAWNAVVVDDPGQCTAQFVAHGSIFWITMVIGSLFAIGLVIYCTLPLSNSPECETEHESYNYSKVNFLFGLATLYIAMLVTNWSVIRYDSQNEEVETSLNWIPVVFDVLLLIILAFMYLWTAISPLCCPSREFSIYKTRHNKITIDV